MGQIGSHVPAAYAKLCVFDGFYTRMGGGDDLASGHSTFMTELYRTSRILRSATERSFVVLDELGRYAFDVYSHAKWACLNKGRGCMYLF
jgi:DNA mismatch repair ATPase MutS